MSNAVSCKIEHHAILFALLAKQAITAYKDAGKEAILEGMTIYGNKRGSRMAANALDHEDQLTTMTNQAYGEWKPDYDGQKAVDYALKEYVDTFGRVKCFGSFDAYTTTGETLRFERSKAKEMLTYLVYKRGASCTIKEIAESLVLKRYNSLAIDPAKLHHRLSG